MLEDRRGHIDYCEEGGGPTIVLVPGSWASGSSWRGVIESLGHRFRTVTTSLPGYGCTRDLRTGADASINRQSEVIEAVIRRTGAPVHLVGHSFGALACLDIALCGLCPLMSLTLIEPVAFGVLRQQEELALHEAFVTMRDGYFRAFESGDKYAARLVIDYLVSEGSFDAMPPRNRQRIIDGTTTHVMDMRTQFDPQLSAFANILLPTLVVRGERSVPSLRRSAEILTGALANASLCTIPEAGHFMPVTHAMELAARIRDHVSKVEAHAWSCLAIASPLGPGALGRAI